MVMAMSEHTSKITWARGDRPFGYDDYSREHTAAMGSAPPVRLSAAAAFGGDPALTNPEDLLVGALSSCHMLTFLAICARKGIVVDRYEDDASGWLERVEHQPMHVTRVTLRPRVTFAGTPPRRRRACGTARASAPRLLHRQLGEDEREHRIARVRKNSPCAS